MTLQEAKNRVASINIHASDWYGKIENTWWAWERYVRPSKDQVDKAYQEAMELYAQSCAQEAREKAIDECMESIEHYWKHNPGFTYEGIQFTLKNLKEKK